MNESCDTSLPPSLLDADGLAEALDDALMVLDPDGEPRYCNPAATRLVASLGVGEGQTAKWLLAQLPEAALAQTRNTGVWNGTIEVEVFASPPASLRYKLLSRSGTDARPPAFFVLIRDVSEEVRRELELERRLSELQLAYARLSGSQEQLLQSEKMASIGQLAAGVAHEINNPIGYVHSNLGTLQEYLRNLISLLEAYDEALRQANAGPDALEAINQLRSRYDLDFVTHDLPELLQESREGIDRVCKIVRDLKEFSYAGRDEAWTRTDLHRGLESTINIVWNELKYKCTLRKEYGELPPVECLPSELNQVFMNILVNAGQAIEERGEITVRTGHDEREAWVAISDNGAGIPEHALSKLFDPFYTSKPVGTGTGLGLSISYGIVSKHHGRIEVDSTEGEGSTFRVVLPLQQPRSAPAAAPTA